MEEEQTLETPKVMRLYVMRTDDRDQEITYVAPRVYFPHYELYAFIDSVHADSIGELLHSHYKTSGNANRCIPETARAVWKTIGKIAAMYDPSTIITAAPGSQRLLNFLEARHEIERLSRENIVLISEIRTLREYATALVHLANSANLDTSQLPLFCVPAWPAKFSSIPPTFKARSDPPQVDL